MRKLLCQLSCLAVLLLVTVPVLAAENADGPYSQEMNQIKAEHEKLKAEHEKLHAEGEALHQRKEKLHQQEEALHKRMEAVREKMHAAREQGNGAKPVRATSTTAPAAPVPADH